jgi:hypothetical protein
MEVTHVLVPLLDCLHEFDSKKVHMMLALMFELKFNDLSIVNKYVKKKITTIVATRYDYKTF